MLGKKPDRRRTLVALPEASKGLLRASLQCLAFEDGRLNAAWKALLKQPAWKPAPARMARIRAQQIWVLETKATPCGRWGWKLA